MTFTLPPIPEELRWLGAPAVAPTDWSASADGTLTITAPAQTDWFLDPGGDIETLTAPAALFSPPDTAYTLSARVEVEFGSTFDAGVLVVRQREDLWAKLCFEYSPQRRPTVVSVVTRGRSDDCNSASIEGNGVHLRLAANGAVLALHYSIDGRYWQMARYCTLGEVSAPTIGFLAQSPTGGGCTATFSETTYRRGFPADLRNGE